MGFRSCITVVVRPGRLRIPRDELEAAFVLGDESPQALFPPHLPRVLISHTRPEPMLACFAALTAALRRRGLWATSTTAAPSMWLEC